MGMNDENHPPEGGVNTGAAVFGSLVFSPEHPDHGVCDPTSPLLKNDDAHLEPKDHNVASFKEPKEKELRRWEEEAPKRDKKKGLRQREPTTKPIPHRKNPLAGGLAKKRAGYRQQITIPYLAGESVNTALNGVRRSKEENFQKKAVSVSDLRQQRRREREEALAFNIEVEQMRRHVVALRKKLNARFCQSKVDRERKLREDHLAKVDNEIQFNSQVHVEHKRTLKEQEDAKRRMSADDRAKLQKNHQQGKEQMKLAAIEEDNALLEERHESSAAVRKTRLDNANKRRESFAFRNGDARRIRELFAQREADKRHEEHDSYELKWAGERDATEHKKQMAKERRESLAFRNAEGRRIRDLEAQMAVDVRHREHESFKLKWAGERDADIHRKQTDEEKRQSFARRNAEGRCIRNLEGQMKAEENHCNHESFELKWAGERDADSYRKHMEEERRNSFAFRNAESKCIRDLEGQMKADENNVEHESYELKWAGERDADDYKKQMAEERRQSFANRNAEGRRIRDLEDQMKAEENHRDHESFELKWAGERDADGYQKRMEEEKRKSFAFRNAEGKCIRDFEVQMKADKNNVEHESYELKWAGERDADDYKKQMAEERREDLALRNAEGRRIRDLEGQMKADVINKKHESYELNWAGERDADGYKKQMAEERRKSLAFRNAEGRRIRDLEALVANDERHQEHESFELQWTGERDADDYRKQMDEERRASFEFRNTEGRKHAEIEKELAELTIHQQHMDTYHRSEDARYIEMAKLKESADLITSLLG